MPFGALLPKTFAFFDLFEAHAEKCVEGSRLLLEILKQPADAETKARQITEIEDAADHITHKTVETLHRTFITPIDRDEIHRLITRLDDILDYADAAAQRIVLYEITDVPPSAVQMGELLLKSTELVREAVHRLRNLDVPMEILRLCSEIDRLENEADHLLRRTLAKLYKEMKNPIELMKWKEIHEYVESATDRCEDVARVIEGVILEHA